MYCSLLIIIISASALLVSVNVASIKRHVRHTFNIISEELQWVLSEQFKALIEIC